MHDSRWKGGELGSTSWGCGTYLHKLLEILLLSRFVYSPKYFYVFRYLFISVWTQGYLSYTFGYNPIPHCLFCWLNDLSFGHWELFQSALNIPLAFPHPCLVFLEYFLTFWHCKVLQAHNSIVLAPEISHFSEESCFLLLENSAKNQASLSSVSKESACNVEDLGLISGSGRSLGEGNDNPLQYSCLEKSHGQRSLVGYSR